jgi:pimeloyl-ACP methyl ester carboxylesterase
MPEVRTNGVETHYEQRGAGPPVVFVHGALSDHTAAARQLETFGDAYTVVAYDVRGHGRTTNPGDAPYSVDVLAEDLHAFVDAMDFDQPVVCGVSMGGMIAQTYASRYPGELSALVLADTFTPAFVGRRDRIERSVLLGALAGLVRVVGYDRAKGVMTWLGRTLAGDAESSLRADAFPDMRTTAAVNSLQAVANFHEVDVDLGSIDVPTLVLYGEHETSVIRRHVPTLAAEIPDVTVQEVPDAGHATPWDNPEFFDAAVRGFLAQSAPSPGGEERPSA